MLFCLKEKKLDTVKLVSKNRISSKTIKRHDAPKTPYQRIVESPHIPEPVKQSLSKMLATLNPFVLRTIMEAKLKKIFSVMHSG